MGFLLDNIKKEVITFASLLPEPVGSKIDLHFKKNGWELQAWDTGSAKGYQIFFGSGVQVDNNYEYGFPYLYDKEELLAFAQGFYGSRVCQNNVSLDEQIKSSKIDIKNADYYKVSLSKDDLHLVKKALDFMGNWLADKAGYSSGEKCWDLKDKFEKLEKERSNSMER